jgi:hypothetical protein
VKVITEIKIKNLRKEDDDEVDRVDVFFELLVDVVIFFFFAGDFLLLLFLCPLPFFSTDDEFFRVRFFGEEDEDDLRFLLFEP